MASKPSPKLFLDDRDDLDSIYENIVEAPSVTKKSDSDVDDSDARRRRNSRGSSSTEESSGASSFTPSWVEEKLPPKKHSKLRISNPESRTSGGSVKYSYDEVSINFGKPVISQVSTDDDIFGSVTFQSPIEDLSVAEKEMLFSVAVASHSRPVPAPRPSKSQPKETVVAQPPRRESSEIDNQIYEDPDDLKSDLQDVFLKSPPQVPPRNVIIMNENTRAPKSLNSSKNNSYENVYCEIHPSTLSQSAEKSKQVENIMDRKEMAHLEEDDDIPTRLGAIPRKQNRAKADTIDIRNTVSRWYEEAEKEVTRDLSLDLSLLEKIGSSPSTVRPKSDDPAILSRRNLHQYEHVAKEGAKFALVNGRPVEILAPRSSQTLLRDFDPIFEGQSEKKNVFDQALLEDDNEDDDSDETSSVTSSNSNSSNSSFENVEGASSNVFASNNYFGDELDPLKESDDSKKKNKSVKIREENLYVKFPGNRISGSSIDLPPPNTPPPPPPPITSPPPLRKNIPGYENVWIGPTGNPAFQPDSPTTPLRSFSSLATTPPLTPPAVPPRQNKPPVDLSDTKSTKSTKSSTKSTKSTKSSRSQKSDSFVATSDDHEDRLSVHSSVLSSEGWQCFQNPDEDDGDGGEAEVEKRSTEEEDIEYDQSESPVNRPQRSFSALNLTSKVSKIASNLGRKMSDQVIMRSVLDGRSVVATDLGRRGSGSQKRGSSVDASGGGLSKPGTKNHSGVLFLYSRMKRSFQPKWCVLGNGNFRYFNDKHSLAIPKELIYLNTILSLRKHDSPSVTGPGDDASPLYCFDVVYAVTPKGKHTIRSFGAPTETEREAWIFAVAQSLSIHLESVDTSECSYLTWAHLKTGFAGDWCVSWITLTYNNRTLTYTNTSTDHHDNVLDLKKIKNVTMIKNGKNLSAPDSALPVLVVDATDRSIYLQLSNEKECTVLREAIEAVAFNTGNSLKDQQLTHEGIPVIVDKCIRFVYSHGCMTEGIYRLSGVNTKINKLLSDFRQNAWSVHIARDVYSEHDVANTLKRFLRTLDEPILEEHLRSQWMEASSVEDQSKKLNRYRDLLRQLPSLNYQTLRRLIGHLNAIADKCAKNLMPNYNLAAIWGPTLLTVDGLEASNFARTSGESDVCRDLIDNYEQLFNVNQEELERERKITEVLERINLHDRGRCLMKRSGDLRMWVYLDTRSSGNCVCVEVHPTMTALEMTQCVIREAKRLEEESASSNLMLHEVVLGGMLERPIHHSEIMLEVTLKWGTWSEADRRENYLVLKTNTFYDEALPCAVPPMSVFGEAYFSENKPGKASFKKHQFSMNNARLTCTRELKSKGSATPSTVEIGSWPIEDICWYLGCESKRRAPYNLNVTFIERGKPVERSKEHPHFGRTISFESREFFIKWIASMLVAEHAYNVKSTQALLVID